MSRYFCTELLCVTEYICGFTSFSPIGKEEDPNAPMTKPRRRTVQQGIFAGNKKEQCVQKKVK